MTGEEFNKKERFEKRKRTGWRGEELDEREKFDLFIFWSDVLDVRKQKNHKSSTSTDNIPQCHFNTMPTMHHVYICIDITQMNN